MTNALNVFTIEIDSIPKETDIVMEIKRFAQAKPAVPTVWTLVHGSPDPTNVEAVELEFGISDQPGVGVLMWGQHDAVYVPAIGTNSDYMCYRMAGLHETYVPPKAEVPLSRVYDAVAEFLETRSRPLCVEWVQAESPITDD